MWLVYHQGFWNIFQGAFSTYREAYNYQQALIHKWGKNTQVHVIQWKF